LHHVTPEKIGTFTVIVGATPTEGNEARITDAA
jgi:hypothetical protein